MANSTKSGIIGAVIGIVITIGAISVVNALKNTPQPPQPEKGPTPVVEKKESPTPKPVPEVKVEEKKVEEPKAVAAPMAPVMKKTIKPAAVDRVFPKIVKGNFAMIGHGEDAKWGIGRAANFQYSIFVIAESQILSKKALPNGTIKVEEIRTFNKVQDSLVVSDVDFKLALDTLPMDTFSKMIDAVAIGWTSLTGDAATSAAVITTKKYFEQKLRSVDGIGVRKLLGMIGFQPTPDVEAMLNKLAGNELTRALGGIRHISGKSYLVTYYQEKSGQPLMVTFKNKDGSDVTDDEEKMVLRRINAFIDYSVVPNTECRPGDTWSIAAEDMQEVFDPFVEGKYSGDIKATRKSDATNGDWRVEMAPSTIRVIADNGTTTGTLQLKQGRAVVNPEKISINEMFVAGKANLLKLSKHHWLFTARIDGLCDFQGRVVTEIKE